MRFIAVLIIGVLAAGLTAGWLSRPRAMPPREAVYGELMARLDADHDGRISLAEWQAAGRRPELFTAADANRDGMLDVAEFEVLFVATDPRPLHP